MYCSDENTEEFEMEGFTLKDRLNLLKCCAFLLSENFSLYSAYQKIYLHIPVRVGFYKNVLYNQVETI